MILNKSAYIKKNILRQRIASFRLNPHQNENGEKVYAPVIVLDNGVKIHIIPELQGVDLVFQQEVST